MKKNFILLLILISSFVYTIDAQILAWQFGTPASTGNEVTYTATTVHPNVFSSVLGRGSLTSSTLARAFSSTNFNASGTKPQAIISNHYYYFQAQASSGYKMSLSTLDYKVRRSSTGPNALIWQYSIDGINFFDIGSDVSYTGTATDGDNQPQLNLAAIPALQNVNSGTTITFRLYAWGASAAGGTFAIGRTPASTSTNVLILNGTVECISLPTVNASATSSNLCQGDFTTLNGSGTATSYTWSGGVLNGISFNPPFSSTYTVTGTDALGCSATSSLLITVNPLPTITATPAAVSVCAGQSTTLSGGGGTGYTWTGGITDNTPFTPSSSFVYQVTGTDANGCSNTATSSVTVNPLPTVTATPATISVCTGTTVTLNGGGANLYSWSGGISDNVAFTPTSSTIYTVTGTDGNNCSNTATSSVVVNNFTLSGSPNPEILYYKFDGVGSTVPNLALTPPIGTSTATILGSITQGSTGQGGTALVGSGVSSTTDYLNTNWAPNLGGGSWTISFWSQGISTNATLYYIFGDIGTASFRCFTNGVAGAGNWILRGAGLTDILITGGAQLTPTLNTYVYDATLNNVKAYLNGVLVNTVAQSMPNLTGTGPLKVMGYSSNIGAPLGGKLDEFRIYNRALLPAEVLQLLTLGSPFAATASPNTICAGGTVTLNATGANSYIWNPGSASGSIITANPLSTTIYTITGSDVNGCTSNTNVTVTVNPLPTITATPASVTVCAGQSTTLAGGGGTSYTWTGGITDNTPFTPSSSFVYQVTGTDANGCSNTATSSVTVNASPNISTTPSASTTKCDGAGVMLTANSSTPGTTFEWNPGAVTNASITIPGSTSGTYVATVTDANTCTATASVVVTNTPASGILTQATASNAQSTTGNGCSIQIQPNDGSTNSYFDASCNIIASVIDAPGGNALGNINTCVTVDGSVQLVNGQPYARRWFEITPTSNGPADVILYLTQDDFDDYNASPAASGWPPLPTAPLTNYANVRITKNDAGVLSVITPTIMWDATNNRYALSFPVTGFSQFRVHSVNAYNAPLPVTYKEFTARKEATTDVLDWTTGSEENNKQFNVERSANGEEFTKIGTVASKAPNGTSQIDINYTFVDEKPMTGHNYYRLAQEDIDGKISYSKTLDLIWGANGSTITMYPNPTTDVLNVDINATTASNITIRVMDMSGRTVKTTEARTEQGVNNVKLNMGDIASGIYNVQIVENGKLIATERVNKK